MCQGPAEQLTGSFCEEGPTITPILQMGKLWLREDQWASLL